MKRGRKIISLMLAVCILLSLSACSGRNRSKAKITKRIQAFEDSFHTVDINGMMDCIDPADVAGLRLALMGISLVTGEKPEELTDIAEESLYYVIGTIVQKGTDLPEFDTKDAIQECLKTVRIRADEISSPTRRENDQAVANCVLEIKADGQRVKSRVELNMVKSDGEWYIDLY